MERYTPVNPSSLLKPVDKEVSAIKSAYNNFSLKTGIILKTYELDDEDNISKISVEYDVLANDQQGNRGTAPILFKKCMCLESFGGVADFFESKLRGASKDEVRRDGEIEKSDGSLVLLLCINGSEDRAIIVGSVKHPARKTVLTKEAGIHMEGEYNGVNWQVNKDGELTVTFKSASSIKDGKVEYQDEEAGGSFIKVDKTGSIDLNDGKTENVKIDKTAQTIDINAEKDISNTTGANFNVTAKKNIDMKCTMDLLIDAQGKSGITIAKDMNLEVTKNFKGKAKMWDLEAETMMKVKTKQMMVEGDMMQLQVKQTMLVGTQVIVSAPMVMIGAGAAPALTMRTKFIGTGNLGLPVISSPMGPYSPGVFIAT